MRMSIIVDDQSVYVAGKRALVDMQGIPAEVHAVQWYGDHGWVEFKRDRKGQKDNKMIKALGAYAKFLSRWKDARIEDLNRGISEIDSYAASLPLEHKERAGLDELKQKLEAEIEAVRNVRV